MKENGKLLLVCILLFLLAFGWDWYKLLTGNSETVPNSPKKVKTDTVYIHTVQKEIIRVPPQKEYLPQKVFIYLPDTTRRQQLEKDTLIAGITLQDKKVKIEKITPLGISMVSEYHLPSEPSSSLQIDAEGKLALTQDEALKRKEQRKKRWRKVGNTAIAVGAFAVGVLLAK